MKSADTRRQSSLRDVRSDVALRYQMLSKKPLALKRLYTCIGCLMESHVRDNIKQKRQESIRDVRKDITKHFKMLDETTLRNLPLPSAPFEMKS